MVGKCISTGNYAQTCQEQCGADGGTLVQGTGVCQCNKIQVVDQVCDDNCRAKRIKVVLNSDGTVSMYDPVSGKYSKPYDPSTVTGFGGTSTCKTGNCTVLSVGKRDDGSFTTDYSTNPLLTAAAGLQEAPTTGRQRRLSAANDSRRELQTTSSTPAITNPVLCVKQGAVIVFDVNPTKKQYPVYVKDSILNTN